MKHKPNELVEVIQITEDGEDVYFLKPSNPQYQFYKSQLVPKWLFNLYVEHREQLNNTRKRIRRYFVPLKDKPMRVERNHVNEGEVHRFGSDGSVTVIRDG